MTQLTELDDRDTRAVLAMLLNERPIPAVRISPGTWERIRSYDVEMRIEDGYRTIEPVEGTDVLPETLDNEMPQLGNT